MDLPIVALLGIIWIDLLLSGDNAVVIAMVAGKLPPEQQRKVIIFGTLAAVVLRIGLAFIATWLMMLYGLSIVAGLYLLYVAVTLVGPEGEVKQHKSATRFWAAVATITLADVGMSLDNVLAIAALSHGHPWLMAFGIIISIPMMVLFSVAIVNLIERYPLLKWIGAAVLGYAAGGIIAGDPLLKLINGYDAHTGHILMGLFGAVLVVATALWIRRREEQAFQRYFS